MRRHSHDDNDFPASNSPSIPWKEAVASVPLGNSVAPGPPSVTTAQQRKFGKKRAPARVTTAISPIVGVKHLLNGGGGGGGGHSSRSQNGDELGGWDPMADDHKSRDFNSYQTGAGALMQAARDKRGSGGGGCINLFITYVPTDITKEAFREMFGRAGKVIKANLIRPTPPTKSTTYGFIEYGTMKEATNAIQMFNNFDMGNGVRLLVKVSEKREDRDKRLGKKREEEEFLSTLHCGKYGDSGGGEGGGGGGEEMVNNGYEMTEEEMSHPNPLLPSYKPRIPVPGSPHEPEGGEGKMDETEAVGFSLGGSGGALNLQALKGGTSPPGGRRKNCTFCERECSKNCQSCQAPYCDRECQTRDWSRHRSECREKRVVSNSQTSSPAPPPPPPQPQPQPSSSEMVIREKVHSDDEGFDIPTPPLEELIGVLGGNVPRSKSRPSSLPGRNPPEGEGGEEGGGGGKIMELSLPIVSIKSSDDPSSSSSPSNVEYIRCKPTSLSKFLDICNSPGAPLPSLPLGCQPPKRFRGVITSAMTCTKFTVVLMSVEVKHAISSIAQCEASSLALADPLCLVPGSKVGFIDAEEHLYRMEVIKILPHSIIELRFHDFGGILHVPFSDPILYTLPEEIVTIPCLSYRCCLNGLLSRDFDGAQHLMNVAGGRLLQITIIAMKRQPPIGVYFNCEVHLPDNTDVSSMMAAYLRGHNVVTNMSPRKVLLASPSHSPSPHTPPRSQPPPLNPASSPPSPLPSPSPVTPKRSGYKLMYMAKDADHEPIPSPQSEFYIVPQVVDSPGSIWAHVVGSQLSSLRQLQLDLRKEYGGEEEKKEGDVYSPRVGELCVVKHCQDHQYYRAEVLCVNNNGTADIRFVDYGQREMVLVSQIQHIVPAFLSLPIQGLHFALEGVAPSGHALNWGDDAIVYIRNKILNKKVTARLVSSRQNVHSVALSDPDYSGKCIAEEMIGNGWCVRAASGGRETPVSRMAGVRTVLVDTPQSPLQSPPPSSSSLPLCATPQSPPGTPPDSSPLPSVSRSRQERDHVDDENFSSSSSSSSSRGLRVPSISLPVGSEQSVVVLTATNPLSFHVQTLDRTALETLSKIFKKLNTMKLTPLPPSHINNSCFCVARYSEDNLFYRSKIWKTSSSVCSVKFIDYGNVEDVPVSDLYILPDSCAALPTQAIQCSLQYFKPHPTGHSTSEKAQPSTECSEKFKSMVQNREVVVVVKMVMDDNSKLLPKHVVEVKSRNGKDLLSVLVEMGHALPERRNSPKKQRRSGDGRERKERGGGGGGGGGGRDRVEQKTGREVETESQQQSLPRKPWGAKAKEEESSVGISLSEGPLETSRSEPTTPNLPKSSPPQPLPTTVTKHHPAITNGQPSTAYPLLSSLEKMEMTSEDELVEVVMTSVSDLPNFYVQLASLKSLQMISKLESELNSGHLPPPSPHPPAIGQLVVCKYHENKVWYRASVMEVSSNGDRLVVQFIDYGNYETVSTADVVPCPQRFLKYPILSLKCALNGIYPPPPSYEWSSEAVSFLLKYCERVLHARIESRNTTSGILSVQLIDSSSDKEDISIAEEMIGAGLASPSPPKQDSSPLPQSMSPLASASVIPPSPTPPPQTPPPPQTSTVPPMIIPQEREFEALVLYVSSLAEFYLHPVVPETTQYLSTFMSSISEHCFSQTQPPTTPPPVGHYCLSLFDGNWYRAKVESYDSTHHTLSVFFVDYGNREMVQLSQIRSLPAQFCNVPGLVVKCALSGIGPSDVLKLDHETCAQFGDMVTSSKMSCHVVCYNPLTVDLTNLSTGMSVRDYLCSAGKLSPSPDAIFSMKSSNVGEEEKTLMVTEFHGPEDFWLQSSCDQPLLVPLMEKMNTYCNGYTSSSTPPPTPGLVLGQLCCARFSEDEMWYRARVIGFLSANQCQVLFMDYGNSEVCDMKDVLSVPEDLIQLPALGINCCLSNWKEGESLPRPGEELKAVAIGWKNGKTEVQMNEI